jgi:chromate transporter
MLAAMSEALADSTAPAKPSLAELFLAFAKVSLSGFGGVLPWARRLIVEQRRWMTAEQFNEAFSLSQFLPGPNVVNFSVVFGSRFRGIPGAVVALLGLLGPPVVIVTALGFLYARYGEIAMLQRILSGVSAAAVGLFVAVAVKMAVPVVRTGLSGPLIALIAFVTVGVLRWPLPWVLAVLAPVSIAVAWWKPR